MLAAAGGAGAHLPQRLYAPIVHHGEQGREHAVGQLAVEFPQPSLWAAALTGV